MLALIPLFPLAGFLINAIGQLSARSPVNGRRILVTVSGTLASLMIFLSFIVSLILFVRLHWLPEDHRVIEQTLFPWIQAGGLSLSFTLRFDALAAIFSLVITGVGTLIHVYSIGYMARDNSPGRYFAYLNLFCFAMLVLVLGASLPVLFLGWEGVGLCSYLLIGYWYGDYDKASAGKKAFIANRIGDLGFLLAIFLIYANFGTLDFEGIRAAISQNSGLVAQGTITAICLLLFLGCTGKSAQIPLYVWLPDAMAGPTPVSALIHAATMVTSGVYLVARLGFLYELSPLALSVMAVVGGATAFFAATIAIAQKDIKKILAYSTISQLGYMFMACGVGAMSAGVFHVVTHAFFKALLFLAAGSVIHALHEQQDITKMGGLRYKMPKTFLVFAAAWLAISGIPPFSGFFSKDEILWRAFSAQHGSIWLWLLGAGTALMTAIYMTRLFVLVFLGDAREEQKGVHESPLVMVVPLQILAVLSIVGGFIGFPHFNWLEGWLEPAGHAGGVLRAGVSPELEWLLMTASVALAAAGVFYGLKYYTKISEDPSLLQDEPSGLGKLLSNKWYVDEIYEAVLLKPIVVLANGLWKWFDIAVIDRLVNGVGWFSNRGGQAARMIQTGSLQVYAAVLVFGVIATLGYLVYGLA